MASGGSLDTALGLSGPSSLSAQLRDGRLVLSTLPHVARPMLPSKYLVIYSSLASKNTFVNQQAVTRITLFEQIQTSFKVLPSGVLVSMCFAISSQFPKPNCSIASKSLTSSLADQLLRPKNIPIAPESYKIYKHCENTNSYCILYRDKLY